MKFYINELKEKPSIDFTYDYSKEIESTDEILAIEPAKIHAELKFLAGELHFDFTVDVNMVLACSKTLKPVPYQMHFKDLIIFGESIDADFPLTNPLEIPEIIYGYIVSEKPYTIYHPDADHVSFEQEKRRHPAFADLDKIVKK